MHIDVALILILIDVQHLQDVVCSFKKGSNGQNYSSSDSHHPIKMPPKKISRSASPHPLTVFGKPCNSYHAVLNSIR